MHYKEIAQEIIDRGYRTSIGATPADTVATVLITRLKNEVTRVSPGIYALNEYVDAAQREHSTDNAGTKSAESVRAVQELIEDKDQTSLINAYGMFWRREDVYWGAGSNLWGTQQSGSEPVDFSGQAGIYLLYDTSRIIYVGRVTEPRLGQRLLEHTRDRLQGRWNAFSWFGVRPVLESGKLGSIPNTPIDMTTLIRTMEALLIEGLEPPQNRRQGDHFAAIEFIQYPDPKIAALQHREFLAEMLTRLNDPRP